MTFLADMYGFLDPPSRTVLFSVDDRSLFPVDCMIMIGLIYMVGECWLTIFRETGCALTSGKSSFGLGLDFAYGKSFFFTTACHSNSNQCFNMRDRPMSINKNRPYLLQKSNFTVYFNAKRRFWVRASKQSTTRSMSIYGHTLTPGGTCPSAPCLATPLNCRDLYLYFVC